MSSSSFASPTSTIERRQLAAGFGTAVLQRRATPRFTEEPVPAGDLDRMLQLAREAPSGYNFQPWRFLVLREAEQRARLHRAAFEQPKIKEAPVVVVAFGQREAWKENVDEILRGNLASMGKAGQDIAKMKRGALDFIGTLDPAVWLNRQVMIGFTYLMLAAEMLGWDTAPMEGFDAAAVRHELALPADAEVVALLAVGRAQEPRKAHPGRLPVERFAFDNRIDTPWNTPASTAAAGTHFS